MSYGMMNALTHSSYYLNSDLNPAYM